MPRRGSSTSTATRLDAHVRSFVCIVSSLLVQKSPLFSPEEGEGARCFGRHNSAQSQPSQRVDAPAIVFSRVFILPRRHPNDDAIRPKRLDRCYRQELALALLLLLLLLPGVRKWLREAHCAWISKKRLLALADEDPAPAAPSFSYASYVLHAPSHLHLSTVTRVVRACSCLLVLLSIGSHLGECE